ncbi:MAG: aminotransferase class V-fold PLP-dependent enzyme [Gammaproteobacteria bacterium]|jgi:cysteine desulfurase|nr:aminotransferase class V-fold PLP-dependent enzyme [Gammaproteobacteria bacterium]
MIDQTTPIYLDHNASTPLLPEVVDAMLPFLHEHFGNPSSSHVYGRTMHDAVERARTHVAALIDCDPKEVFFTSGGTEANNLAIRGVAAALPERCHIVTSLIEHPATVGPCTYLERHGYRISRVPVDSMGRVDLQSISAALCGDSRLVTIMHANSETGTLQPIRQISDIAHDAGALMHSDAAQTLGKVNVSVKRKGVDLLSIAGHKLYAPQGVGALFVRAGTAIEPLVIGAGHERGLRPGTENVASIVGLGQACAIARRDLALESARVAGLRNRLWDQLREQIPDLVLNGHPTERLPNTLNVLFPGVSGNALLTACPAIAASTGSACHEAGESASAVIMAMGIPEQEAIGSVRLTLGRRNTQEEIDRAAEELIGAWKRLSDRDAH